jgi:hypothetical protein
MTDLAGFLLARIGEDQAAARRAAELHGRSWYARRGMIVG